MNNIKVDFKGEDFLDHCAVANATLIRADLRQDRSFTMAVVGKERLGKTTFAAVFASIVDPTLCLDRVVFPTRELKKVIHREPKHSYKAIIQDEGAETWLTSDASSSETKEMVRYFMEIGVKNLFVAINIPDVSMIQRYMKSHRLDCIVRILRRGLYAFYSEVRVKQIRFDKTNRRVIWPKPNFTGRFGDPKTPFMRAIENKKMVHLGHKEEDPRVAIEREKMERIKRHTVTTRQAAEMIGMSPTSFGALVARGDLKRKYGLNAFLLGNQRRFIVSDVKKLGRMRMGAKQDNIDKRIREEERLAEREIVA